MNNPKNCLDITNLENLSTQLQNFIKTEVTQNLKKKGVIVGLSGGIDSSVTSVLSKYSLGYENIFGLILPEKESSPESMTLANLLSKKFNIQTEVIDITEILSAFGVYTIRENIVQKYFPSFNDNCKYGLSVSNQSVLKGGLRIPILQIKDEKNSIHKFRLTHDDFAKLYSATSIKHRTRMTLLYFFAEQKNFAVLGSTNKSEYIQGYFVKYGDGGVDLEPIQNLFKTQVYQLGNFLEIPQEIIDRKASPDTWSFEVSDEEFFYGIDYKTLDLLWYAKENNFSLDDIEKLVGYDRTQIENLLLYLEKRWNSTSHMRNLPPSLKI